MSALKALAKRLPYPLLLRLYHAHRLRVALPHTRRVAARAGIPFASAADAGTLKRSDTLVIFGGGPSINALPDAFWRDVSRCDTAGTNFWLIHPFVPRMYFCETIPQRTAPDMFAAFSALAEERARDYAPAAKFVMEVENADPAGVYPLPAAWRGQVRTLATVPAPARSPEEMARSLRFVRARRLFDPGCDLFYKQLSSLSFLIGLAAKLRYRRVLLCGIDLRSSAYFYHDAARYPRWHTLNFLPPRDRHVTAIPLEWRVPIEETVYAMQQEVLAPLGIELFVQSSTSALHPRVPLMPDGFFSR